MSTTQGKSRIAVFFAGERERLVRYVHRFIEDTAERDGEDIVQDEGKSAFDAYMKRIQTEKGGDSES